MSKRFTDTDKWKKKWYRKLNPTEKCAWEYITAQCDAVGVWDPDHETAEYFINGKIDWAGFVGKVNGNIEILANGKWFLVDFCNFQYGELTVKCPPHRSYILLLEKHGLIVRVRKGYRKGTERAQEEEEEEEKEKELELEKEKDKEKDSKGFRAREFARMKKEIAPQLGRGN